MVCHDDARIIKTIFNDIVIIPKQRFINSYHNTRITKDNWITQQFSRTYFSQPFIHINCCIRLFTLVSSIAFVTGYCCAHKYIINSHFWSNRHDLAILNGFMSIALRTVPAYTCTITTVIMFSLFHCSTTSITSTVNFHTYIVYNYVSWQQTIIILLCKINKQLYTISSFPPKIIVLRCRRVILNVQIVKFSATKVIM